MTLENIMLRTEDSMLYDSIHTKCPEEVKTEIEVSGFLGLDEMGTGL